MSSLNICYFHYRLFFSFKRNQPFGLRSWYFAIYRIYWLMLLMQSGFCKREPDTLLCSIPPNIDWVQRIYWLLSSLRKKLPIIVDILYLQSWNRIQSSKQFRRWASLDRLIFWTLHISSRLLPVYYIPDIEGIAKKLSRRLKIYL